MEANNENYDDGDASPSHTNRIWSFIIIPILLSLIFLLAAYVLHRSSEGQTRLDNAISMVRRAWHKRARSLGNLSHASGPCQYVPFEAASSPLRDEVLVVDCTAPTKDSATCTHHKKHNNPQGVPPSDTSTGIVLNAIHAGGGSSGRMMQLPKVTTNHFDVDSFLSVWCTINKDLAVTFDPVLRLMARIGDFREALLTPELIKEHQDGDPDVHIKDVFTALKLVCWLNSQEKALFSAPYVASDGRVKFDHFLPIFADVLQNVEAHYLEWQEEYKQVVGGFDSIQQEDVETFPSLGLAIVQAEEPLHYYSLFSHTIGSDYVLSIMDGNRYELEAKYTQFVSLHSRPVFPRLDFGPLASTLNLMESNLPSGSAWVTPNFKDTGPLLRLESSSPLSKAQRYGHPFDRPFTSSSIPPDVMRAVVVSYLDYGVKSCGPLGKPKKGGFTWEELQTINSSINWRAWISHTLEQHSRNELKGRGTLSISPKKPSFDAIPLQALPGSSCPRTSEASRILSSDDLTNIAAQLPGHLSLSPWILTYCTQRDGYSLHTLYRKCAASCPSHEHLYCSVLVIQNSLGEVFGAIAYSPWSINPHRFYGTGETCVFQLSPKKLLWRWNGDLGDHHATDYFQFSSNDGLGVGGAGHFAIWVDSDLLDGSSNPCETFHSPRLTQGASGDFKVEKLEVWHII